MRGHTEREGVTYRSGGVTTWQLRRSMHGRVNQVDLVINGIVWATVSRRSAAQAVRWEKWSVSKKKTVSQQKLHAA
jgi:hypothetical protein